VEKEQKPTHNKLLKNARIEKGWTQQDLADELAKALSGEIEGIVIDVQRVGRWERGEVFPDPKILPALCTVLGKKAEELVHCGLNKSRVK
jgi:transcriptional regulator with XRE-family HTH domain